MFNSDKPEFWDELTPHQKYEWRQENETNSTGHVGVKKSSSGKYFSTIFSPSENKEVYLGTFDTAAQAGAAFRREFVKIHGPFPCPHFDDESKELDHIMNRWPGGGGYILSPETNEIFEREIRPLLTPTS